MSSLPLPHELEGLRRSIAMLPPGQLAMRREQAMALLVQLASVTGRLDQLERGLRALIAELEPDGAASTTPLPG